MNLIHKLTNYDEVIEGSPASFYFQKLWQIVANLLQGLVRPAASATPADNGDLVFELTNDTTLKIKVKGYDGTTRSVSLTLV